jgi:hypothetical protein
MPADARSQARKTGSVAHYTAHPKRAETRSFSREYVQDCFGAENDADAGRTFAAADGMTRTDS